MLFLWLVLYLIHKQLKGAEPVEATIEELQAQRDLQVIERYEEYQDDIERFAE